MTFEPTAESIAPAGVRYRIGLSQQTLRNVNFTPLNPLSFLLRAALIYPDHIAISHPNSPQPVEYTYRVWVQRVQNLAYALIQSGIKPGDRVAVIAPNCPLIADAHNGVLAARGIIVCINTRLLKADVEYIIQHSGAKLILVDHEYVSLVEDVSVPTIVSLDTGRVGDPYEAFLSNGRRFSQERGWAGLEMETDEGAGASLNYTSGTTGRPKGVLCTLRGSYLAAISNAYESSVSLDPSDVPCIWVDISMGLHFCNA